MINIIHELVEAEHYLTKVLRVILYSSIYLALGGVGLAIVSSVALNVPHSLSAYIISFLMIFAMYNMNRYSDIQEDIENHPSRQDFTTKNLWIIKISGFSAVILSIIIAYYTNLTTILMVILPMVLAIIYSFKFFSKKLFGFERLKDIPLMKNILIAFCWSIITTGVVASTHNIMISSTVIAAGFIVFTRFFINTVIFDMRDVEGDKKHNIKTLPVVLGIWKTRIFMYTYLFGLMLMTVYWIQKGVLPYSIHYVNLTCLQAFYYIHLTKYDSTPIHTLCDVVADGEFKVMALAAIVGQLIT